MTQTKPSDRGRWSLIASVIMIGLISLVQPGCNCGSSGSIGAAPVASVFPLQGSDTALTSTLVLAFFGIDMNETTINDTTFTLIEAGGLQVAATVSYDAVSRTATLDPDQDLISGTEYRATISSTVEDASGNTPLSSDFVWSFTVSQSTELVSKDINGVAGNNRSDSSDTDGSGRYIVFESSATNLVTSSVTNSRNHIYRKDTLTGEILLASSDANGLEASNDSSSARISDDGRLVVFESTATNLVTLVGNNIGLSQIYLKDMDTGTIAMISRNAADASNNGCINPDISSDGRFIVFESDSSNLVGLTSIIQHIYLADTQTPNVFELISVDTNGVPTTTGDSTNPSVSNNGRFIAFESIASDLVATDANGVSDVFLRDRGDPVGTSPVTVLVSKNSTGVDSANGASSNPDISGDGKNVVFESTASNIDGGVLSITDIFLSDTVNPATLITATSSGPANNDSANPSLSEDGRFITFESLATNLDGGTTGKFDIFVSDESTADDIKRLTPTSDNDSNNASISSDGRYISFDSPFSFTLDDTNNGLVDTYRVLNSSF